jgi:hypothetical protein
MGTNAHMGISVARQGLSLDADAGAASVVAAVSITAIAALATPQSRALLRRRRDDRVRVSTWPARPPNTLTISIEATSASRTR